MGDRIRVLLVDDSPLFLEALRMALDEADGFEIVGTAGNGYDAVAMAGILKPDVITMDVMMPSLNGIEAVKKIMEKNPTPILILSSLADDEASPVALEALRVGAVDVWPKPSSLPPSETESRALCKHLRLLSKVDVARERQDNPLPKALTGMADCPQTLIAMVAATGGTKALAEVLGDLGSITAPIVIVAKPPIAPMELFVTWLDGLTSLNVTLASDNDKLIPGTALVAPDDSHIRIGTNGRIVIDTSSPVDGVRPSGSVLLRTAANWSREGTIGVIFGGQGSDGAEGLTAVEQAGGVPLVIDPNDVEISEMQDAARNSVPTCYIVRTAELADLLTSLAKGKRF